MTFFVSATLYNTENDIRKGRIALLDIYSILGLLDTDEQLITAASLFEKYKNMMYHTAYMILKNPHDAEDAVADTLIKVCRNIDKFHDLAEQTQKRLLHEYTKNTAIDRYREKNRKYCEPLSEIQPADTDTDPEAAVTAESFGDMQKYVRKLPQKYIDLLIMRYVEEMQNKEIAVLLNISPTTVSTRLLRARAMLLKLYEEEEVKR